MGKLRIIDEPLLEFGRGKHCCPRAGIYDCDVFDANFNIRMREIKIGAVGTSINLKQLKDWIGQCSSKIQKKSKNKQPNLFTSFCGFNEHAGFKSKFVYEEELTKALQNKDLSKAMKIKKWNSMVDRVTELYYDEVRFLSQNRIVDVIVCVIPNNLYEKIRKKEITAVDEKIEDEENDIETNFRRALKAKSMHLGKPLQLVREDTFKDSKGQQDLATKAWNFCTAIYYKAGQTVPWKLVRNEHRASVCYVGIGFYRSRDREILNTSLAQIFNELGNGVILRGTPVDINKDDRRPHLKELQAYDLLHAALKEYEHALETTPGRLVIHKSSKYDRSELDGFKAAADEFRIYSVDFITILDTHLRLYRDGLYPPVRGTHLELDESRHLLYTKGSVPYYGTYPGLYVPQPIEIRIVESEESPELICDEILGLTKMNWNNTQFDGKYPITIECARRVGQIMKYLDQNDKPQIKYGFYM